MRYLLKNKGFFIVLSFALFSCSTPQNIEYTPQISSPYPVKIKVWKKLRGLLKVERVVVVPKGDKYVIQFTVKSESDSRINFLYRVLAYNQRGLIPDFLTEKWTVASLDPYGEEVFEVVIPRRVVGKISKVEVDLKTFAP